MPKLYFGDNLGVLRDYIASESVDLIYLDPPFNSDRSYNLLFAETGAPAAAAQIKAFDDTWHWDTTAERHFRELVGDDPSVSPIPDRLKRFARALCDFIGRNDMMAYVTMMALRLVEMHRVLKPTGSLYLHCDPTASHYLKLVLDAVFGASHFQNEIAWRRTAAKALTSRRLPVNHDVLLFYSKGDDFAWDESASFAAYDQAVLDEKTAEKYSLVDADGRRYQLTSLINPNPDRPNLTYEFLGVTRVWRWTRERMHRAHKLGLVVQSAPGRVPRFKRYLDEQRGKPIGDVWTDISPVNARAEERIGYPTQKPVALLERIIRLSSRPGDVVLDPFCGCGTSIEAAQRLGREWIGIDVTHLAVKTIRERLARVLPDVKYELGGNPADADSARVLAEHDAYQFQDWAVRFVEGRPPGGGKKSKKGKDRGVDGELFFRVGDGPLQRAVISVKGGNVNPAMVRELAGTTGREQAPIGVLITAQPTTKEMRTEAARAGNAPVSGKTVARLQILTVDDLFAGKGVEHPGENATEGSNPPPEQMLLFDRIKKGVAKVKPTVGAASATVQAAPRVREKKAR